MINLNLYWAFVAILFVPAILQLANNTTDNGLPSVRERRCALTGRQCRLRIVAPCPARICRPSETVVHQEIRHISAPIVREEVHHHSVSKVHQRVEKIVQRPAPIVQQHIEQIVQEPVPIVQQKVEKIVQHHVPIVQQHIEKIVQEPVPIVQQRVEKIIHAPIVQHKFEKIVQAPIVQQKVEKIVQEPIVVQQVNQEVIEVQKPEVVSLRITACPEGHYLSPDGTHCKHIDCDRGLQFSDVLLRCVDIDECAVPTACLRDEQCINTYGSYICRKICTQAGYKLNEVTNSCEDINECILGLHTCGPQQNCINTPGSYKCECPPGYRIDGSRCEDINECLESHAHLCPYDTSICENTAGSYFCKCKKGFEKDHNGRCVDVDECLINNGGCSQRCVNKYGSYECHCNNGYKLSSDGHTCVDIDECSVYAESGICSPQTSTCENTPGSYRCRCKTGFRDDGSGKNCIDVDECQENTNLCEQKCINTFGSYKCACKRGYRLVDAHRCEDIDECHEGDIINQIAFSRFRHDEDHGHPKLCQWKCENTLGSYLCNCPHGYNLVHNHHCLDIDECTEHGYCKGSNQTCVNIGGSFRCVDNRCPPGYHREGIQCKYSETISYADICDDPTEKCDIDRIICYSYAYIAFRAKMVQGHEGPKGHEFFTFVVPVDPPIIVDFKMRLVTVKSPRAGVQAAKKEDFNMRRTKDNEIRLAILTPLEGPQDIELEVEAKMYKNGLQIGKNVAIVTVFISEYEF